MTRYRLAAGPMAYCLRRGFLPAPQITPMAARLLSTNLPRAAAAKTVQQKPDSKAAKQPSKPTAGRTKLAAKGLATKTGAAKRAPRGRLQRRARKRGFNGWGPWGKRGRFMSKGPRTPGFKERVRDPETVTLRWAEKRLMKQGIYPIGSRRRRVAIRTSPNIPFEHLPYQCFQDALAILRKDRQDKVDKLANMERKLQRLQERDPGMMKGGVKAKERRIRDMRNGIRELALLVDANDPLVKRNSEDGLGDMNKPIYQSLARERWEAYPKKILVQRRDQFNIVPDVLPKLDIKADVELRFHSKKVPPGSILPAKETEIPPTLKVQVFDSGERLVSVVVLDSDVPDEATNSFTTRCHFLAVNIPLSPTKPNIIFQDLKSIITPWLPPFSQQGSPYHRLGIYILSQPSATEPLDEAKLSSLYAPKDKAVFESAGILPDPRRGFSLKSFRDKFKLTPFSFNIFRTVWDDTTRGVMTRNNIPGADMVWKRLRDPRLKPLPKRKGWEAKRQHPKYRFLWKYTKRIKGWNRRKHRYDARDKRWK